MIPPAAPGTPPPVEASLDHCIKCNICVTACPVAPVTDLFPGPKYEGPQAARFRHGRQPSPDRSVDYCSGCRMCNEVCPTGVRIAEINARARAGMVADGAFGWRTRLRNNLLARPLLLADLGAPVAPLVNALFGLAPARWAAERLLAIHRHAPLPLYDGGPRFRRWLRSRPPERSTAGTVVYFTGCSTEHYETRVGRAAVRLLEALGFEVVVAESRCCGLPLLSNGEFPAARLYHRGVVDSLIEHARAGRPIVGTSTSCTLTLKEEAPELLDAYDPDSRRVATAVSDIGEFLLGLAAEGKLGPLREIPLRLPYHPPCQYRAHRLGIPSREVMDLIPGLEVTDSGVGCCGIAGTYGYKSEKYQVAMDVGRPLFEFVREEGAPVVACDSETCRWQITHATGVPAVHPVEVVAAALGAEVEGPLAETLRPLY
ncbi:MAG: anaerobic glycerol-3-phosphate dehydrogenase subunit C [Actinomycetota bacterium]